MAGKRYNLFRDGELAELPDHPAVPEITPPPERSEQRLPVAPEITPPPPEFSDCLPAEEAPRKKRRAVRKLFAAVMALLLGASFFGGRLPDAGAQEPEPNAPAAAVGNETPTVAVGYAMTDGSKIYYSCVLDAQDPACWPIALRAEAVDAAGRRAEGVSDVWQSPRPSGADYEMDIGGLKDEITLTLTAEYEKDGQTRTIRASRPVEQLPIGEASAYLWFTDAGMADFKALLMTPEGDSHEYELEPVSLQAEALDADHRSLGVYWTLDDLNELARDFFTESGNREYVFTRIAPTGRAPEDAKYCRLLFSMRDAAGGYLYNVRTNICPLPAKTYPLGDERIELVVYNDTLTFEYASLTDDPGYDTVLVHTTLNAAQFSSYELPAPLTPAGYRPTGYVVHFGSPFDNGYDAYSDYGGLASEPPPLTEDFTGEPPVELLISKAMFAFPVNGMTLTREMVERVPIADDGVRYVNVHATWQAEEANHEFYVELDDGQGNVTTLPVAHPLASSGFFFTFSFPQPAPPVGCYFDGWYDRSGKRVDFLMDYFSFTPYLYDENGSYVDYDWQNSGQEPVRLTAHWEHY